MRVSVGRERVRQKGTGLTHSSPSQPDMDQPQAKPQADFIFQQKLQEALSGWHIVLLSISRGKQAKNLGEHSEESPGNGPRARRVHALWFREGSGSNQGRRKARQVRVGRPGEGEPLVMPVCPRSRKSRLRIVPGAAEGGQQRAG